MSVKPGLYRHYKGSYYKVLNVSRHSETEQDLVIYQALYGEKGYWARPLTMFTESVEKEGVSYPRFEYCQDQSEILEVAILDLKPEMAGEFEAVFAEAEKIISSMNGYISHQLQACVETVNRYILLVEWQTLEDHTVGFRGSSEYQKWSELLHSFYAPFPTVEHYRQLNRPGSHDVPNSN